ncbi:MAG TPA: HutD family protein [Burkholderiaceae bacterium]
MTPRLLRSLDVPPQRWRNGGGLTRELFAWPEAAAAWQVRVSVADVDADGPFSAYPGVQRWFTVLKGAGVELTVGSKAHRLERGDAPVCFAGDTPTGCRLLDGPTQDLNLMLRQATGGMASATDGQAWTPNAAQCGLFTAVAGRCEAGTQTLEVPAYALLWFDPAPPSLRFTAGQRPAALIGWWLAASPGGAPA